MKNKRLVPIIVVTLILSMAVLACGGGSPQGDGRPDGEVRPTQEIAGEGSTPTARPEEQPAPASTEVPVELERLLEAPGIGEVVLLTPQEGVGERPLFEWEGVEGAARYLLVLYASGGRSYWAWEGEATSVYLGGGRDAPPEGSSGPVLLEGMSWGVLAFDAEDALIASSVIRPISP